MPNPKWGYFFMAGSVDGVYTVGKIDVSSAVTEAPDNVYKLVADNEGHITCTCPAAAHPRNIRRKGIPCKHADWLSNWLKLPEDQRRVVYWDDTTDKFVERAKAIGGED